MRTVMIESPYAGNISLHTMYARLCMAHSLKLDEAPLASHLLYPQPRILNEHIDEERALGIQAGLAWGLKADLAAFYVDLGMSNGMKNALAFYREHNIAFVYRDLGLPEDELYHILRNA